jgi:hypothetical protein
MNDDRVRAVEAVEVDNFGPKVSWYSSSDAAKMMIQLRRRRRRRRRRRSRD